MRPDGSAERPALSSRGADHRSAGALHGSGVNPRARSYADARRSAARGFGLDRAVRRKFEADANCRCDFLRARRAEGNLAWQRRPNAQEDWNRGPPRHREDGRDQRFSRAFRNDQGRLARFAKLCRRTGLAPSTTANQRPARSEVVKNGYLTLVTANVTRLRLAATQLRLHLRP